VEAEYPLHHELGPVTRNIQGAPEILAKDPHDEKLNA
jgi:hypothetical protein